MGLKGSREIKEKASGHRRYACFGVLGLSFTVWKSVYWKVLLLSFSQFFSIVDNETVTATTADHIQTLNISFFLFIFVKCWVIEPKASCHAY